MIRIYKYSCEGRSFLMVDGRQGDVSSFRRSRKVHALCVINALDGIAILDKSETADFKLEFFRPSPFEDGNALLAAARCAVAYADLLGVKPFHTAGYRYELEDGTIHEATIVSHLGECKTVLLGEAGGAGIPGPDSSAAAAPDEPGSPASPGSPALPGTPTLCEGEFE